MCGESIFDEIRGVWIVDEKLSRVFDVSSRPKQNLRSKRRSKCLLKPAIEASFPCFNLMNH